MIYNKMTKKHFIEVAKMISETKDKKLAFWFADFFAKYNKLFNRERFLSACDIKNN